MTAAATSVVATRTDGDVALILMDNPPVNALGHALRAGILHALEAALADPAVRAIVLAGTEKAFSGGADITEFGKPPMSPRLSDLIARIETASKPVVAAISGFALGGGLELALAAHARVATPATKLGLPEVKLGLLPGAGGTQRLPRLIGARAALDMIVSGSPISGAKAGALGLVDAVFEGDLLAGAVAHARTIAEAGTPPLPVRDREDRLAADRADLAGFDAHVEEVLKKSRGLEAPRTCAAAVRLALTAPIDEALRKEGEFFTTLVSGLESKAQRHLFFAEREAARVAGVGRETAARKIERVGVVGAGTMGGGIAMAFANAGLPVTILEMSKDTLDKGLARIAATYDGSVGRGSLTAGERDARMARLSGATDYADLADCDLIVEAVFEDIAVKQDVFTRLDAVAKPGAILATNTSYLDVNAIAGLTARPQDVVGLHFFSPANVMKLLEIVRGEKTAPETLATALAVARTIGKVAVVVGVCHGFVGNRMLTARGTELEDLLLEGALPVEIDRAFTDFGFPMGPFAMSDLAGLDISWRTRKAQGRTAAIADALCEAGRLGQKTGKGYYLYPEGARRGEVDPEVTALIEAKSAERRIARRAIPTDEIIERTLYPMLNEGARILEEGIAARASDIDVVWVNGYGFPVGKGGPMFFAEHEGHGKIAARLAHWFERTGKEVYRPAGIFAAALSAS
jgi:3-hydroxyacyl-CoA dehydrogenase